MLTLMGVPKISTPSNLGGGANFGNTLLLGHYPTKKKRVKYYLLNFFSCISWEKK
jgi:hypothetical protein